MRKDGKYMTRTLALNQLDAEVASADTADVSIVKIKRVRLTNAQIKALPVTHPDGQQGYIEIVPAVPGKTLLFMQAFMRFHAGGAGYTNIDAPETQPYWYFLCGGISSNYIYDDGADLYLSGALALTTNFLMLYPFSIETEIGLASGWGPAPSTGQEAPGNKPINLWAKNAGGAYTGGHVDNYIDISLMYAEFPGEL